MRIAVATLVLALAFRTGYRNAEYGSPLTLWMNHVDRYPNGRARLSYATELIAAGQHDKAIDVLWAAVPDYPPARFDLGAELLDRGRPMRAFAS